MDVLDRPDLGGGWEEIWHSLGTVEFFNLNQVIEYASLDNPVHSGLSSRGRGLFKVFEEVNGRRGRFLFALVILKNESANHAAAAFAAAQPSNELGFIRSPQLDLVERHHLGPQFQPALLAFCEPRRGATVTVMLP